MAVSLLAYVITFFVFLCNYALTLSATVIPKWYKVHMTANAMPSLCQYYTGYPLLHLCHSIWKRIMVFSGFAEGKIHINPMFFLCVLKQTFILVLHGIAGHFHPTIKETVAKVKKKETHVVHIHITDHFIL